MNERTNGRDVSLVEHAGEKRVGQLVKEFLEKVDHHVRSTLAEVHLLPSVSRPVSCCEALSERGTEKKCTAWGTIPIDLFLDAHHLLEVARQTEDALRLQRYRACVRAC